MRTLGVLGGMSWESTAEYYRLINRGIAEQLGGLHSARIVMHSVDFADVAELQQAGAWHAAGEIHSDIQRGFVRAEVIAWDALVDAGGYAGARDRGVLRLEGRDYVMADGDVITVKFTP